MVCNGEDDCYLPVDYIHTEKTPENINKKQTGIKAYHAINLLKARFKNQP